MQEWCKEVMRTRYLAAKEMQPPTSEHALMSYFEDVFGGHDYYLFNRHWRDWVNGWKTTMSMPLQ
jgi:hypothetical protein